MNFSEILGMIMLCSMVAVIFIGFPISFTLLFLALMFGGFGLGWMQTFDLAYLQIWGTMKDDILPSVPAFIFMGYMCDQAGLMDACSPPFATCWRGCEGRFIWSFS